MLRNFTNRPKNPNIRIWRYMDLPKYISLLATRSLYFSRSDLLGDHFEGSFPPLNAKDRTTYYRNLFRGQDWTKYNNVIEKFSLGQTYIHKLVLPRVYINCWHSNSIESHAMWELYSQREKGIAIRSTYRRLRGCLPMDINIGLVKYINYSKTSRSKIPEDIPIAPFFYKRKSYEHEKELRAIYFNDLNTDEMKGLNLIVPLPDDYFEKQKKGYSFPVDLDNLIENIYIHPFVEPWLLEAITDLTIKYGLSSKLIRRSTLERTPLY